MGHFGPPCAHHRRMAMAKTASKQLRISLRIIPLRRIPKVTIFMAVTTKKVKEAQIAENGKIVADNTPIWNGKYFAINVYG